MRNTAAAPRNPAPRKPEPRPRKPTPVTVLSSRKLPVSRSGILRIGKKILRLLGKEKYKVNFCFVSDSEIKKMNLKFKRKNRVTDVLAFGQLEGPRFPLADARALGDVVISVDAARSEAPFYGNSVLGELALYMIHGVLHLVGYEDAAPSARLRMRAKENEMMACLEKAFFRWRFRKQKR